MTITVTQFRQDFVPFQNPSMFPDSMISFYLKMADLMLTERWQELRDIGTELFVAHHCVMEAQNMRVAQVGGIPGQAGGIMSSKSVDRVSVSYDTVNALLEDWGYWNTTNYGTRFAFMARMVGMGGHQAGVGYPDAGVSPGVIFGPNFLGQD